MNITRRRPRPILRSSACAIALLAVGACGTTASDDAASDAPTSPSTSSSASVTPDRTEETVAPEQTQSPETPGQNEPRLIDYAAGGSSGVAVHDRADAEKLDGAPDAFRQFVASTAEGLVGKADCDDASVGVRVKKLRTDGFAVGVVSDCDDRLAMWAVVGEDWKEIQSTLDFWRCGILERYAVPSDVAGTDCYDAETGEVRDYSQA